MGQYGGRESGMSNKYGTVKIKANFASLTERQAGMCFANALYDRDELVKDEIVPVNVIDFDERRRIV